MIRNGGLIFDTLLINNNTGYGRGVYKAGVQAFGLLRDVWATNAACRQTNGNLRPDYVTGGIFENMPLGSVERCVASHWKDPSKTSEPITDVVGAPTEWQQKDGRLLAAMRNVEKRWGIYDDPKHFHVNGVVHNWVRDDNSDARGLDPNPILDRYHIEAWGEAQPGNPSDMTVEDVLDYMRTSSRSRRRSRTSLIGRFRPTVLRGRRHPA